MRFFFSACTSEYESSFRSFPLELQKLTFIDVCRSHFEVLWWQVCRQKLLQWGLQRTENYWKILGTSHHTARKERSDAAFKISVSRPCSSRPRFYSSKWPTQTSTNCYCNCMERMVVSDFSCYLILPFVEPLLQAVLINKTCICHPWIKEQTSFWTVWWTLLYLESRHAH